MAKNIEHYRIFEHIQDVDISEQDIWDYCPDVLRNLLVDHTMTDKIRREAKDPNLIVNIFWATNNYESRGEGYQYKDQIKPEAIVGEENKRVIMPRVLKDKQLQTDRTKDKAEVFTPSWVCNAQNNLVDEAWFGYPDVFNHENINEQGIHVWTSTGKGEIKFPEDNKDKTWQKYVSDNRLEITCGEAPYLVSRYDTTTGEQIPIHSRIGILDRKFRVINENVGDKKEWYKMAEIAIKHTYGYEWQGDNLVLAREALLYTYIEYYIDRFNEKDQDGRYILDQNGCLDVPDKNKILNAARWISWNIWQMDGIKMVIPDSCHKVVKEKIINSQKELFAESSEETEHEFSSEPCPGCAKNDVFRHNGVYCLIRDWNKSKPKDYHPTPGDEYSPKPYQKIEFKSLLYSNGYTNDDSSNEEEQTEVE